MAKPVLNKMVRRFPHSQKGFCLFILLAMEAKQMQNKNTDKHDIIYGAIVGDYFGSNFEFSSCVEDKAKSLDIVLEEGGYTDDTVMSVAVAEALLKNENVASTLRKYGKSYPYPKGGYGGGFFAWLRNENMGPYGSFGNGAGMRASPVAYFASSEEECIRLSDKVTAVTHNAKEGLKGARVIALCIYKALHGASKEELRKFAEDNYEVEFDLEELHQNYEMDETCQGSVPQALYCFLSSNSFDDCLRRVCYIGGDADTIGAMACAIASAYYKEIPAKTLSIVKNDLPKDFIDILDKVPANF